MSIQRLFRTGPGVARKIRPRLGFEALEIRLAPAGLADFRVMEQPAAAEVYVGQPAVFEAVADAPGLGVRWQSSADGGANWSDVPGEDRAVTVGESTRTWYAIATAPGQDGLLVRAVFLGAPDGPRASLAAPLDLERAPASIAVQPSASPRSIGEAMTVSVRVGAGLPGLPAPAGGLVRVSVGPIHLAGLLVGGVAVFDVPDTLDPGSYAFSASYDGDAYVAPAAADLDPIAVQRGPSRVEVAAPRELAAGGAGTVTAYVGQWMPEGQAAGGVVFLDGGRPVDFAQLSRQPDGRYAASLSPSKLTTGDHYFQFVFLGNPRTYASSSGVYRVTVKPAGSTVQPGPATPMGATTAAASATPSGPALAAQVGVPFAPLAKLTAGVNDSFGLTASASADGSLLAVGAFEDASLGSGSVTIYERSGDAWTQAARFSAAGAGRFGFDVALSADGSTLAVGAPLTTVGGRASQGAVYVYAKAGASWNLVQTLTASDGRASDRFGYSVATSADGGTIAVGSERGGGPSQLANKVSAYVFARSSGVWSQQVEVEPAAGTTVAVDMTVGVELSSDGGTLLVTALTTTPGGLAAVYAAGAGGWTRQLFLDARSYPGVVGLTGRAALSPDGAALAAGARIDASPAAARPAVLVLGRSGSTWSLSAVLTPPDPDAVDPIGAGSVGGSKLAFSPDGATLFAGAPEAAVDGAASRGAVHVFARSGGTWSHVARLTADDGVAGDNYGATLAASDGVLFVSAFRPASVDGRSRGAVYAYRDARMAGSVAGPSDRTVLADGVASFTAEAVGGFASVQWQASVDDGLTWANIPGATGLVLTFRAAPGDSGTLYRAVFRTADGTASPTDPATLTVARHAVRLDLKARENPRRVGDPLIITVAARAETSGVAPTGMVDLTVGTLRFTAALVDGVATFAIPTTLAVGTYTATAAYGGDGVRFEAATTSQPLTVVRGSSTVAGELPTTAVAGAPVRITAVLGHSGTVATPAGGVMFMDGGRPIAFEQIAVGQDGRITATFTTSALAVGDHYFQLVYLGNPGTYLSSSTVYRLTITPARSAASPAAQAVPAPVAAPPAWGRMRSATASFASVPSRSLPTLRAWALVQEARPRPALRPFGTRPTAARGSRDRCSM